MADNLFSHLTSSTDDMSEPALILASSDRLARLHREDYSLTQRRSGYRVWEAPQMMSLRQFVQESWTAMWPSEQLLHSAQELAIWRQIIERDDAGANLLSPLAAAREARRADQLIQRYQLKLPSSLLSDDHIAFQRWRSRFRSRLMKEGWLTALDLFEVVADSIEAGRIAVPKEVKLTGFEGSPLPIESRVISALQSAGSVVTVCEPQIGLGDVSRARYVDAEAQVRGVAVRIREVLSHYQQGDAAPPRILFALPDPEARRELIESIFRPMLAPWLQVAGGNRALPWRWEDGARLIDHPLVASATVIAELKTFDNAPALVGRFLLASAMWSDAERSLCANVDETLRRYGYPRIRWSRVVGAASDSLQERFKALGAVIEASPRRALPSAWVEDWRQRLSAIGWPGNASLDSAGYQALREWDSLLTRLSAMDAQVGKVTASEALTWTREIGRSMRYQPRVEHTQPVLIVKLDDAVGLPCDELYVADLDDARFPAREPASPYLPIEVQSAAGIPGSSAANTLAKARRTADAVLRAASKVFLSYAEVDERGASAGASPVFGVDSDWRESNAPGPVSGLEIQVAAGKSTQVPDADPVPPVSALELPTLRADSAIFKAIEESPFFALCRYRLGVEELQHATLGLDPRRQGTVAHGVMQKVWGEIKDSAALSALDDEALQARIDDALGPLLEKHMSTSDYGVVQVSLEFARLADVLSQWLRHERNRIDPFEVAHIEHELNVVVGGLPLNLRIDRIDRVIADGSDRWLVLDYKTGRNADPRGWSEQALSEPQLPLYASHAAAAGIGVPHVDGICFGHLKDGHPALVAATNWRKLLIKGSSEDMTATWDERLSAWRMRLASAAVGFLAGDSRIRRKVNAQSHYSDLVSLAGNEVEE